MTLIDLVSNPIGLRLDKLLVRLTGYSFVTWVYNRASGVGYIHSLLLTNTGAKSGSLRRAVLPYYEDGERFVIVGSNGGAKRDPHWAVNLRRHPEAVVHVARRRRAVRAHIAAGEERERLWGEITKGRGPYAYYQKTAAPREIPVVVLSPR